MTRFYKKRDEQKKKEDERRREKMRRKEEEKKSKSYNKTEMRDKLKSPQKERIKEIAKRMKEESKEKSNQISSLGKIPKLSKSEMEKKTSGPSFGDMMGGLDSIKSKPKAAPIKNKNKDLLESLDSSPLKPKPRSDVKSDKHRSERSERSEKEKERSRDKDRDKERERHKSRDKERHRDKDKDRKRERRDSVSKSSDGSKHHKSEKDSSERPKPKIVIPEKRSHKDSGIPSPKEELKKSPKVIKESNFLGDILGDIMKEPPRKKKRRPSDVKVSENNLKELAEKAKAEADKVPTPPESEKENTPESEKRSETGELEFSEPTSDLPREVRGILVYVKGNKAKRKIQWRTEDKLVDVRYIEIEEDERVNVFKVKSFEEMKKKEAMMEKTKRNTGFDLTEEEQDDSKFWRLIALTFEGEQKETADKLLELAGQESQERKVQASREASVLKALQLSAVPRDPSEPDPGSNDRTGREVREIPVEDISEGSDESAFSYSDLGWPAPAGAPSLPTNLNTLLSNITPSLINSLPPVTSLPPPPDLSKPPPSSGPQMSSEEQQLLAAQKAAAAALGFHPPPHNNGFTNGYNRGGQGGQRGQHYQDRGFKGGYNHHGHNNQYNRQDRFREGRKEYTRPCKFWMERGRCKEEDRCLYPHPSR